MCWNPLDTRILGIRTAASSEASAAIIPWSTRIVRALYRREAWDVLGGVLRKSAHPPRFSSLCANKNGLRKHYPA